MPEISPAAGDLLPPSDWVNVPRLVTAYFAQVPDPAIPSQRVAFGTSGHRGSALATAFNEAHILAITQAICLYRRKAGIDGPLFLGADTHALSEAASASALEVLAANCVATRVDSGGRYVPTPVVSHAILRHNRGRGSGLADGIVITPSHNPPDDGGFKYNPPSGGPAGSDITAWIEKTANDLLASGLAEIRRWSLSRARHAAKMQAYDFIAAYVDDLPDVLDLDVVRTSGVRIGIDPLGGASISVWEPVIERYGLAATVTNAAVEPDFRFMPADWDGKIRMDCSSPYAMARLIGLHEEFDIAFGTDTDADRHGIVTRTGGLMKPNDYLTAAIAYLLAHRPGWPRHSRIGKTIVSSSMIDRVAAKTGRHILNVPVGFKWFVDGLKNGMLCFAGEESAGASFLRKDGSVWTTDKDGIIMALLAAEITARTGRDPSQLYESIAGEVGRSYYRRRDKSADPDAKARLKNIAAAQIKLEWLAGKPVRNITTKASGHPIGGFRVDAGDGWFAVRPSGTEEIYKIYSESFIGEDHLTQIEEDAQQTIARLLSSEAAPPPRKA